MEKKMLVKNETSTRNSAGVADLDAYLGDTKQTDSQTRTQGCVLSCFATKQLFFPPAVPVVDN